MFSCKKSDLVIPLFESIFRNSVLNETEELKSIIDEKIKTKITKLIRFMTYIQGLHIKTAYTRKILDPSLFEPNEDFTS